MVIGLDCLDPRLAFQEYAEVMPHLTALRQAGGWGKLRSITPPITMPAWSCALSGRDPGALGVYGFRNRGTWGYGDQPGDQVLATGASIRVPRAFEQVAATGKRAICLSIPGTYPPPQKPNLDLVSCFLAPELSPKAVSSPQFYDLLQKVAPTYQIDVRDFRTDRKDDIQKQCTEMMQARFDAADALLADANARGADSWAFFMLVEIGTDRMHHAFWSVCRPEHPRYTPDTRWQNALRDYYALADVGIGRILQHLRDDDAVIVMSDHGARALYGGMCTNQWLIQEGYLVLKNGASAALKAGTKLTPDLIDWSHTKAWGDGGYYARIFLNVQGREPQGIVPRHAYAALRQEIAAKAENFDFQFTSPNAALRPPERTKVFRCEDLYPQVNGYPPDLMIFWGNLDYRSIGTLGWPGLVIEQNDSGPDEANHDWDGVYVGRHARLPKGELSGLSLLDVGPTLCALAGAAPLPNAQGRNLAKE